MALPSTEGQNIEYLTHLQYVHSVEAARRAGINVSTAKRSSAQDDLPQAKIRALVTKMATINTLIVEHEGGNDIHGQYIYFGGVESRFKVFFVMRISALVRLA